MITATNNTSFNLIRQSVVNNSMTDDEKLLEEQRITLETKLAPMQPLFKMFNVPCFYRCEIVGACGKAKSGKTFYLSMLMACAMKNEVLAFERLTEAPLKVLWIDTEQSQQSTQEILKDRIVPLAELDPQTINLNETFYAFNLRGLGFDKRGDMMSLAIKTIQPDICIIDGIKDLMTDINDAVQATLIMEKLMALAKKYKCCIVCVLHLNKSEQDRNMRGSIGTELTNKAFEVFQCEVVKDGEIFKVCHTFSRKQKMKRNFYYHIDEKGLPVMLANYKETPRDYNGRWMSVSDSEVGNNEVDLKKLFINAMEGHTQRPYGEVMGVALKKCGVADAKTYYQYLDEAIAKDIVRKMEHPETHVTWIELIENTMIY